MKNRIVQLTITFRVLNIFLIGLKILRDLGSNFPNLQPDPENIGNSTRYGTKREHVGLKCTTKPL